MKIHLSISTSNTIAFLSIEMSFLLLWVVNVPIIREFAFVVRRKHIQ